MQNPAVRERLADWYVKAEGLRHTGSRVITALSRGEAPGPEAAIIKVVYGNTLMESVSFALDLLGMGGAVQDAELSPLNGLYQNTFLSAPGERIGGGTEEIMLNIIAERVLRLPGDVRTDKDIPFNQIRAG
jgi:alkylation response protein AidB-like acyl-CoA dehydrogenase